MAHVRAFAFSDQSLREEIVQAHMRLRIAALVAKRLDLRKVITVRCFLKEAIRAEPPGLGFTDLALIGECFGIGPVEIKVEMLAMNAEGVATFDESFRLVLPR